MSNSTYISDELVDQLVCISGGLIRDFLNFLIDQSSVSAFSQIECSQQRFKEIQDQYKLVLEDFAANPGAYDDAGLVQKGDLTDQAHKNPVRIEVRRSLGVEGAALVAARGVHAEFRSAVLDLLPSHKIFSDSSIEVKLSGSATFEFTQRGVDKALALLYLNDSLDSLLDTIGYNAGKKIDARLTRTVIAADGDGTTYGHPFEDQLPLLMTSPALVELLTFLEDGGVYVIVSGNSLQRTFLRVTEAIPDHLRSRLLICANGGANLAYIDPDGELIEIDGYREKALDALKQKNKQISLDVIYIGDDPKPDGNDFKAFECVGKTRSFVVAETNNPFFESTKIVPGKEVATAKLLKVINAVEKDIETPLFTGQFLEEIF